MVGDVVGDEIAEQRAGHRVAGLAGRIAVRFSFPLVSEVPLLFHQLHWITHQLLNKFFGTEPTQGADDTHFIRRPERTESKPVPPS